MGSRGVGSYSYNRKVQLANKIATINKKLAKIEQEATVYAQKETVKYIKDKKQRRYYRFDQFENKWNKMQKNYEKGHYMQEKGAGKLRQQKKQYQKELAKLNAGQMRMFR